MSNLSILPRIILSLCVFACFMDNKTVLSAANIVNHSFPDTYGTVISLYDFNATASPDLLIGASKDDISSLVPPNILKSNVSAFLLKTRDGKNILFDTGFGDIGKPAGKLFQALQEIDISPADINAVMLTHMHRDHIGGLLDANGKARFPSAVIYVADAEKNYWLSDSNKNAVSADKRDAFDNVRKTLAAYGNKVLTFSPSKEFPGTSLIPSVTAMDASGHTPGHTVYIIGGRKLILGDTIHFAEVQFPKPYVSVKYDVDPDTARETRMQLFKMAVEKKLHTYGIHLPYPASGFISFGKEEGSYTFMPDSQ